MKIKEKETNGFDIHFLHLTKFIVTYTEYQRKGKKNEI
jgi:hypothetical protein